MGTVIPMIRPIFELEPSSLSEKPTAFKDDERTEAVPEGAEVRALFMAVVAELALVKLPPLA